MPMTMKYVHDHECSREGQEHVVYPNSVDGVSFIIAPTCEEFGAELRLVSREVY